MDSFLRKRVVEGSRGVWPQDDRPYLVKAKMQVEHELHSSPGSASPDTSSSSGTSSSTARAMDPIQGRGSAADSAVCYGAEITAIDPLV